MYSLTVNKVVAGLDVTEIRPTRLYFLDHSRVIMVASAEKWMRRYGGKHRVSTAFSLDIASGEVTQLLTPGDNIVTGQLGLGDILGASADGKRVYMPAFVESRRRGQPDYALMEVDLESVPRPGTVTRGTPSTIDYFVDQSGNVPVEEIFNNYTDDHSILAGGFAGGVRAHFALAETISAEARQHLRPKTVIVVTSPATLRLS